MPTKKSPAKKATTAKKKVAKKAVKKTAKKAVKKPAKKTTKRSSAKKSLVYSSDDTSFWASDGSILNSLVALNEALNAMEQEVYSFHATGTENDFANWVEVVLCDGDCAKDLRKAKSQKGARTVVVKHLKYYAL